MSGSDDINYPDDIDYPNPNPNPIPTTSTQYNGVLAIIVTSILYHGLVIGIVNDVIANNEAYFIRG